MKQLPSLYSVLVLFGKEIDRSVASPANFADLTEQIASLLVLTGCRLTARGTILGAKRRKVAPRRGPWSPVLRDKYIGSFGAGSFRALELFDSRWHDDRFPNAFGSIHKYFDYSRGVETERTDIGAENNVTVALREDLVDNAFERLKAASHDLLEKIDGFYGTIESGVPWEQPVGRMFEDMIDIRWHNRGDNDYGNGEYQVQKMVPRLNRGNLLCRTQFTHYDLQGLQKLRGVTSVEKWPGGLTYLELNKQPEYGSKPPPRFADFIRFIPEEEPDA